MSNAYVIRDSDDGIIRGVLQSDYLTQEDFESYLYKAERLWRRGIYLNIDDALRLTVPAGCSFSSYYANQIKEYYM